MVAFFTGLPFLLMTLPLTKTFSTFLGTFFFFFLFGAVILGLPPYAMLAPPSSAFGLGPNEAFILLPSFVNSTLRSFRFLFRVGQACIVTVADSFFLLISKE